MEINGVQPVFGSTVDILITLETLSFGLVSSYSVLFQHAPGILFIFLPIGFDVARGL